MSGSDSAKKIEENQGPGENISAIAFIRESRCTHCGADMAEVIQRIKTGEISPPKHCPSCGTRFSTTAITEKELAYYCGHCDHRLFTADPAQEAFCSHCGYRLLYPEGHIVPKQN